jgi:hypothetical protein
VWHETRIEIFYEEEKKDNEAIGNCKPQERRPAFLLEE